MARVEVYTTQPCGWCEAAKALLRKRGIEFEEHLIFGGTPEWEAMMRRTGGKTVPQVVIDGEVVGGFDRLSALDADGGLAARPGR